MKENYEVLEMEIVAFEEDIFTDDNINGVITNSGASSLLP